MDEDIFSLQPGPSQSISLEKDNVENKLTQKFLKGEISFAEYTKEWYGKDDGELEFDKNYDERTTTSVDLVPKISTSHRRKYTRLSTALLGLMGEANIRFVRGDKEVAEKMCHEIIRQVPTAPEPYQTLAQIYENDPEKSLQFSLLAAHLSPSDANEWVRLADISEQKGDPRQAMLCYTQAIKGEPQNPRLHLRRVELLEAIEEKHLKHTMPKVKCYHKIVNSLPPSEGELILKYMKLAAKLYHSTSEIEKALEVMSTGYKKCTGMFTLEDVNMFLELLISNQQYQTCIEVFVANVGVEIEAEIVTTCENDQIEESTRYMNCRLPDNMPIDLKCKLIICFIYLNAKDLVRSLLKNFFNNDVENTVDLYLDLEEALTSSGMHDLALSVLEKLTNKDNFDLGAVWLKHAECLKNVGRLQEAINSYKKVLIHAPQHALAKQRIFRIYENLNRIDDALKVLEQDPTLLISAKLLHDEFCAAKKYGKIDKMLEVGEALLTRHAVRFRHKEEIKIARISRSSPDLVHNFRIERGEPPYNEDDWHFEPDEDFKLTPEEEWNIYKELYMLAYDLKKYHVMQRISVSAYFVKKLNQHHRQDLDYNCLIASLCNNDIRTVWTIAKEIILKLRSVRTWNLLNYAAHCAEDPNTPKYLTRLFERNNSSSMKCLFIGNNFFMSGRYLLALGNYLEYNEQFKDPLSTFLIALCILISPTVKRLNNQDSLFVQGFAYLTRYANLKKCDQETYYNFGRAFQMLSLNNLAIEYYERALDCQEIATCEVHGSINLKQEIAYNLYTLYRENSPHMARHYMLKYLVI